MRPQLWVRRQQGLTLLQIFELYVALVSLCHLPKNQGGPQHLRVKVQLAKFCKEWNKVFSSESAHNSSPALMKWRPRRDLTHAGQKSKAVPLSVYNPFNNQCRVPTLFRTTLRSAGSRSA